MCGIVGLIGDTNSLAARKMFKTMLFLDTVRGKDSTGVIRVNSDGGVSTLKDAVTAERFLDYKITDNFLSVTNKATALIGHNRAATVGSVTPKNAHPFNIQDITMVHNGTLRNERSLPSFHEFDVDSEMFTAEIARKGLKDTISRVRGAYTIVFHDNSDNSLNFIRNSERPLCIATVELDSSRNLKNKKPIIAIASEAWMIQVAANKSGMSVTGKIEVVDEMLHTKIDLNTIMSLTTDNFIDAVTVEELEEPATVQNYGRYMGYVHNTGGNSVRTETKKSGGGNVSHVKQSTNKTFRFRPVFFFKDPKTELHYVRGLTDDNTDVRCILKEETYADLSESQIETISASIFGDEFQTPINVGDAAKKTIICSEHLGGFFAQKKLKALPSVTKTS